MAQRSRVEPNSNTPSDPPPKKKKTLKKVNEMISNDIQLYS